MPDWDSMLINPEIKDKEFIKLCDDLNEKMNNLENDIKNYKNELIMKQQISFEPFDNKSFGDLKVIRIGYERIDYPDGDWYEGEILNDEKHGKGTGRWSDGDRYERDWLNDQRTGYGIFYSNRENEFKGDRYEVEFLNNYRH
jgi:hypothetical protein